MRTDTLLPDMLALAVPLWIMQMRNSTHEQRQARARQCAELLGESGMGEAVLYNIKGKSGRSFNAVAESIAILAFQPGGVRVFGALWCARHPSAKANGSQICPDCLDEEVAKDRGSGGPSSGASGLGSGARGKPSDIRPALEQ